MSVWREDGEKWRREKKKFYSEIASDLKKDRE